MAIQAVVVVGEDAGIVVGTAPGVVVAVVAVAVTGRTVVDKERVVQEEGEVRQSLGDTAPWEDTEDADESARTQPRFGSYTQVGKGY